MPVRHLRPRHHYEPPPPAEPTTAFPGTSEKIQALAERLERGVALWHPLDALPTGAASLLQRKRERRFDLSDPQTLAAVAEALRLGIKSESLGRQLGCSRFTALRLLNRLRADLGRLT
jgi:hypothetical protein